MTGAAKTKYRDLVREIALDQYGFVTISDAIEAGVPAIELPKLAARGGLDNVAYGLYRVSDIPMGEFDQFAEALFRVGPDAYLYGESVLALFSLANVNPNQIKVATPKRVRRTLPGYIDCLYVPKPAQTTTYEGLPSQFVKDALLACQGRIENLILKDAAQDAKAQGLLTTSEMTALEEEMNV